MSFIDSRENINEAEEISMSYFTFEDTESFGDSLTEPTADAETPDLEAEPDGCDQQSTDDHTYNQAPLSYELQQGLRILKELMSDSNKSVNWHFLEPVDDSHPETADYYGKIKKPIWFGKMKEKFDNREYGSITQFVGDFRQMLENCYRFNGPDHFVSKRAQKLETMMEQKLNLLSRDLREKTSISATSGQQQDDSFPMIPGMRRRSRAVIPHDSTALLNQLRVEELQKGRDARKKQMLDRKAVLESHIQGMMEWEDKLMEGQRENVKAMWELPSIGLLLFLCHYPLNIGEVAQFELERCLFMPRESSTLQRVMTTLLSTPFQRHKLDRTGIMPYRVWNEKLRDRMAPWFKLLKDSQDLYKVADKFGIDPYLFQVVGKKNPLRRRKFHELSLYKKVWILKSLCDNVVENQESLVKTIESQYPDEQKEYKLGEDADGNTYIHFPQFCGVDVRIYRQAYIPEPEFDETEQEMEEDDVEEETTKSARKRKSVYKKERRDRSKSKEKTPIPKKKPKTVKTLASEIPAPSTSRPSRLRQTPKTVLPVTTNEESSTDEDEIESTDDEASEGESTCKSESEEPEGCTDSGVDNNTPFKNILRNRIMDRDNFSETSSLDSNDIWSVKRTRSGRIRYNGAMRMNNDLALVNENSYDLESTFSENSNAGSIDMNKFKKGTKTSRTDFNGLNLAKNFNGLSENDDSDVCHKPVDETGDCSSSNSEMISKTQNSNSENPNSICSSTQNISSEECDIQKRETSCFEGSNQNYTTTRPVDLNEDSSTSNDFSEIDSQDSAFDGNNSEYSSQHKSDIMTLNRIFDQKTGDKMFEDSDTNSSFNVKCDSPSDHRQTSDSPQHLAAKTSADQSTVGNILQESVSSEAYICEKNEKARETTPCKEIDEKEVIVREATPCKELSDGADTDTEFDEEKMLTDNKEKFEDKSKLLTLKKNTSCHASIDGLNSDTEHNSFDERTVEVKTEPCDVTEVEIKEENSDKLDDESIDLKVQEDSEELKTAKTEECSNLQIKKEKDENGPEGNQGNGVTETDNMVSLVKEEVKDEMEDQTGVKRENNLEEEKKDQAEVKEEMEEIKEEVTESDDEEDESDLVTGPEIGPLELIAESVEDLRNLVEKFAEPEPYTVGRGKKTRVVKPPARKRCVVQLHNRLCYLLKELEPWEQKLIQATKKARLKMKKEYECYDEKDDDGWESDHSESTNSATEDTGMDVDSAQKPRQPSIPKDFLMSQNDDSRTSEDCGEWDISLRGRIRKRRIIPNNVEDQGLSKKRKTETTPTTTSAQVPNKSDQSSPNMVSLVTSSASHLLLHTSGGQTYYTGLNQQSLSSLRMLSHTKQTAHPIIQQLLRQPGMDSPRPLASSSVEDTSQNKSVASKNIKKATTPQKLPVSTPKVAQPPGKVQYFAANINSLPPAVIQQLIKSNALSIQAGNSQQGMILLTAVNPAEPGCAPGAKATLTLQNPVTAKTTSPSQQTTSLSQTVATIDGTSANIDKVAAVVTESQVETNKLMKNVLTTEHSQQKPTIPVANAQMSLAPGKNVQQNKFANFAKTIHATPATPQSVVSTVQTVQSTTFTQQKHVAPTVPISVPRTSQPKMIIQQSPTVLPVANQGLRLQNFGGVNVINPGGYVLNTGQNQGVALNLNPTLNIGSQGTVNLNTGQSAMNIGGQGLTLQQIQALALQGINLQGISLQGSNIIVQPNAGLRIQTPVSVHGQQVVVSTIAGTVQNAGTLTNSNLVSVPVQGTVLSHKINSSPTDAGLNLLNPVSCSIGEICPPISPVIGSGQASKDLNTINYPGSVLTDFPNSPMFGLQISPGRTQCKYASNVTVKTLLEARKPSFTETSPENHGTIVVQSTATGIKKLKLPSKAALDSAIQTVVTEVKTSLPTANIKVPSPVTMPSIQPRRNITKTIQSMKVPIPTTPKVETKSNVPINIQVSPPNYVQPMSPAIGQSNITLGTPVQSGQPNLALASPIQSGILNMNQVNNAGQIMLTNFKSNTNIPTGQNVVQGYLTPQGLIIPSANLKNFQNMQKTVSSNVIGNSLTSVEPASPLLVNSSQIGASSLASLQSNSLIFGASSITDKNELKHLQNVQDLRNIAAINSNIIPQIGSQQFVQKPMGLSVAGNQLQSGNFVYLSPSANVQQGSQILLNTNQPLTSFSTSVKPQISATGSLNTQPGTIGAAQIQRSASYESNAENCDLRPVISLPLGAQKKDTTKSTIMSLPLASVKADCVTSSVSSLPLASVRAEDASHNLTKSQVPMLNTFGSNATLLSHLNSPILKTNVNHFATSKSDGMRPPSAVSSSVGQNNLSDGKTNIQQSYVKEMTLGQKSVLLSPQTRQVPILLNQQGSSSEIMKQLAAAQVLGTPVKQISKLQNSNVALANGNKLVIQVPGQSNVSTPQYENKRMLQIQGQMQNNTSTGSAGKLVIPVSRPTVSTPAPTNITSTMSGLKTITSLPNKVMIQVPGQPQSGGPMLLISPQKQFILGSQTVQKSTANNVSQTLSLPSTSGQVTNIQKPVAQPKDQVYLRASAPNLGKSVDFPVLKGQNVENIFKFPNTSVNNSNIQQTSVQGVANNAMNSHVVPKGGTGLQVGNRTTITTNSEIPYSNLKPSLQTTVTQSPAKSPTTPQKLFLYNINGQLVTAQGVPVTVDNGILKILPQPKIQMSNFNLPKSPPAASKPHGNVPISPKPGQPIVNTQQAYLNVLSSTNSALSSASLPQYSKSQTLPGLGQNVSDSLPTNQFLAGIGTQQPKSVVRNLNSNLTFVTSNCTASSNMKHNMAVSNSTAGQNMNVSGMLPHDSINTKPSHRFVVMPETGGQTQIVFPQPNIHSSKALVNTVHSASSSIMSLSSANSPIVAVQTASPSVNSQIIKKSFVQSSPVISSQTSKVINAAQKFVNSVNMNHHNNINGQNVVTTNPATVKNTTKSNSSSTVDAEEAALNLLSLANQRFSS
ncbi:uncharacterized protein KIAA2026-like [Mytilus californianus]|uniref:uncharacterized protein KIAA2026-like n=1 Tax=Mytilus californianus TaxID=6549 RepID=UPI00224592F5|nr:uncharacterized protein KIAA2026-like [Mytilus californianus]